MDGQEENTEMVETTPETPAAPNPAELQAELERTRAALKAANAEAADRRRKLADMETAEKQRQQAAMSEGERLQARLAELERAATERDALSQQVGAYSETLAAHVKGQLKQLSLPKATRALLEEKSPLEQLAWLNQYGDELRAARPADIDAGTRGARNGQLSSADVERLAANYGVSVAHMQKALGIK